MIRVATTEDQPLVRALYDEFNREVPDAPWREDDDDTPPDHVLLADDVGVAALTRRGDRMWFLDLLYVRSDARGGGTGKELLRAAAQFVREQGAEMLELEVLESNTGARRLYERLGFTTVERNLAVAVDRLLGAHAHGPTFGAVHVQTDDAERVRRDAVKVLHVEPDVEFANGWVRVRAEVTDGDPARLKSLARELSYMSAEVTLALGVEQGAVVRYVLYDRGSMVDEYLSVPEFYGPLPPGDVVVLGANPTVVARLTNADAARVRAIARTASAPADLPPAQELYEQIADVMGVTV
jgi:GNAT superfamily N-acetyltransferase